MGFLCGPVQTMREDYRGRIQLSEYDSSGRDVVIPGTLNRLLPGIYSAGEPGATALVPGTRPPYTAYRPFTPQSHPIPAMQTPMGVYDKQRVFSTEGVPLDRTYQRQLLESLRSNPEHEEAQKLGDLVASFMLRHIAGSRERLDMEGPSREQMREQAGKIAAGLETGRFPELWLVADRARQSFLREAEATSADDDLEALGIHEGFIPRDRVAEHAEPLAHALYPFTYLAPALAGQVASDLREGRRPKNALLKVQVDWQDWKSQVDRAFEALWKAGDNETSPMQILLVQWMWNQWFGTASWIKHIYSGIRVVQEKGGENTLDTSTAFDNHRVYPPEFLLAFLRPESEGARAVLEKVIRDPRAYTKADVFSSLYALLEHEESREALKMLGRDLFLHEATASLLDSAPLPHRARLFREARESLGLWQNPVAVLYSFTPHSLTWHGEHQPIT